MSDSNLDLLGVNLAGAEFGSVGQAYGTGYTYPTHAEIDYEAAAGMNVIRLPFLWERLQPTLDAPLDPAELARIDDVVTYAASKGLKVVLDVHNYGSFNGQQIGSAAVPTSAFADLWSRIASHFALDGNVMFGLMNEPQQSSASDWLGDVNAAIGAIRTAGATQEVLVPGIGWDGAWTWTTGPNAATIGSGVIDPANDYAFEVHQYLDQDGSGTHAAAVSSTIGSERLAAATAWAEQTGHKLFLGEFGAGSDATSLAALGDMLSYMNQHADVWQGGTYWAAGPWWGDYMYSAEPSNGVDTPQMKILEDYAPASGGTVAGSPPAVSDPPAAVGASPVQAPASAPPPASTNGPGAAPTPVAIDAPLVAGLSVAFDATPSMTSGRTAILTGTVSDPTASVDVTSHGIDLGTATVASDGRWTLPVLLSPRLHADLTAVATTATSSAAGTATYTIAAGIRAQPYKAVVNSYGETGILLATTSYNGWGQVVSNAETIAGGGGFTVSASPAQDHFVFQPAFGQDTITGFQARGPAHDVLSLPRSEFGTVAQVLARATDTATGVVLSAANGDSVTLAGVSAMQLNRRDFSL